MPDSNHLMSHCKCHGPAICRENGSPHGWPDWKVALITGASRGQGEAEAPPFAERAAKVVIADIRDEDAEKLATDNRRRWRMRSPLVIALGPTSGQPRSRGGLTAVVRTEGSR